MKDIRNNVFHVTEEFAVSRTGMTDTYRPDIVLFVNGIPLCVIECKRPDVKDSIEQAISQHLRNQKADGIRSLYLYSTLLLAINRQEGSYATTATPEKFWRGGASSLPTARSEARYRQELERVVNEPLLDDKLLESGSTMCTAILRTFTNSRSPRRCRTNTSTASAGPNGCCS